MLLSHVKWSIGNWVGRVVKFQAIFCKFLHFSIRKFDLSFWAILSDTSICRHMNLLVVIHKWRHPNFQPFNKSNSQLESIAIPVSQQVASFSIGSCIITLLKMARSGGWLQPLLNRYSNPCNASRILVVWKRFQVRRGWSKKIYLPKNSLLCNKNP